ncbi:MAG: cytochrome c peroxidase [Acetobacteraceae bacterium]|jgi:cytochrome c peroxidase|nr:cytochrome c peroxidase [Acetobacteraceae bacterium]MEA2770589.1 cytochrome c peroxidase [Acetobacteraceae bacterium]
MWPILKSRHFGIEPATPTVRPLRRRSVWFCLALLVPSAGVSIQAAGLQNQFGAPPTRQEPITPIPQPPAADARKVALGERLFGDHRLSHDGTLSCLSCHDLHTNGTGGKRGTRAAGGPDPLFDTLTIFNAALSFRLNWEGNFRTLEAQTQSSLENSANLNTNVDEVLGKLNADPKMVDEFRDAYDHAPDGTSLLDAIATYERSLLTPGSRFDLWLQGDPTALNAEELTGYGLFKSLGCVSCHQGVNVGGNLYERHGIFHPLASPKPEILRVPSLRNVAVTAPYFQDGSAATLDDAVRKMGAAQLDLALSDQQIQAIVAFLRTLTGTYRGVPLVAASP